MKLKSCFKVGRVGRYFSFLGKKHKCRKKDIVRKAFLLNSSEMLIISITEVKHFGLDQLKNAPPEEQYITYYDCTAVCTLTTEAKQANGKNFHMWYTRLGYDTNSA